MAVVGAGQAGLATGYFLQRAGLSPGRDFVLIDAGSRPGGAWPRMWEGLRLFSPAAYSSLPGRMMPPWHGPGYPTRQHVVDYLTDYEQRYRLEPLRPHRVSAVRAVDEDPTGRLEVRAPGLRLTSRVVVSATGTWDQPFWPALPGRDTFRGQQLHAAGYRSAAEFAGRRVVVVGGGNSAAQILAEVSAVTETVWATLRTPRFLPDEVDGRALFDAASARVRAARAGEEHAGVGGLGDIVMVPDVRAARQRGVLQARPMFTRMTPTGLVWSDGTELPCDVVLWCTGFRPALRHLARMHLRDEHGRVPVGGPAGTQSVADPRVHLVGYGDWVGPASATLIGVGRSVRASVEQILADLA